MSTPSNRWLASFIGLTMVAAGLFLLLGATALLRENLQRYEQQFREELKLEVFLRDDTAPGELSALISQVRSLPGVRSFQYRDRSEFYLQMQRTLGTQILPEGGANPFPNALDIAFTRRYSTYQSFAEVAGKLRMIRCVEDVTYDGDSLQSQERVLSFLSHLAVVQGLLVLASILITIFWGLRKAAMLRRDETRILKLLGAGWKEIGFPMLFQGMLLGLVAALLALLLLYLLWHLSLQLPLRLTYLSATGTMLVIMAGLASGLASALLVARGQLK